jgi:hypothetical protein
MATLQETKTNKGWGTTEYQVTPGVWDSKKSAELLRYSKIDPSMQNQIADYTKQLQAEMGGTRIPGPGSAGTDIYTLAQDMYLRKMQGTFGSGTEPTMPDESSFGIGSAGTSSRPVIPDAPTIDPYTAPKFALPERDEAREGVLTAKYAAPGLRAMRRQVQSAMGKSYANPNVKRLSLREALSGYGEGIENVLAGASNTAANQYGREYGYNVDAAKTQYGADVQAGTTNYGTKVDTAMRDWQNKWQGEMAGWEQEQKIASEERARKYDREMTKYKLEYDKYLKSMG